MKASLGQPLTEVKLREEFAIIGCDDCTIKRSLMSLGLLSGITVTLKAKAFGGSLIIGNDNFSIAIEKAAAERIFTRAAKCSNFENKNYSTD